MPSTRSSATPEPAAPTPPPTGRRGLLLGIVVAAVAAVALLTAVLVVTGSGDETDSTPRRGAARPTFVAEGPAEVGGPAPAFTLPGLDGGTVSLSDFAGKPVIVNFWASYCRPCRKEFPMLKAARAKHANDGLEVIGVSYEDIASDGRAFVAAQGADWAFARDPDGRLALAYGVRGVPQTFFVDGDGTVVEHVYGLTTAKDLEAEIRKILPASRS